MQGLGFVQILQLSPCAGTSKPCCRPIWILEWQECLPAHLLSFCSQVGQLFQQVSEGRYSEQVLPYLLQAAPFAGVDRIPFQQALQTAVRDKRQVPACLPRLLLLGTHVGAWSSSLQA